MGYWRRIKGQRQLLTQQWALFFDHPLDPFGRPEAMSFLLAREVQGVDLFKQRVELFDRQAQYGLKPFGMLPQVDT